MLICWFELPRYISHSNLKPLNSPLHIKAYKNSTIMPTLTNSVILVGPKTYDIISFRNDLMVTCYFTTLFVYNNFSSFPLLYTVTVDCRRRYCNCSYNYRLVVFFVVCRDSFMTNGRCLLLDTILGHFAVLWYKFYSKNSTRT
jgi:hypothetical protein